MDGAGRGNAAERTLTKQEEKRRELNNQDFSESEPTNQEFRGGIYCSNVPEKLEIVKNDNSETETTPSNTELTPVYRNAEELEIQYELLAEGGGLELLEAVETGEEDISDFNDKLVEIMSDQGLINHSDNYTEFTDRGAQVYNNWTGFREYLAGNTDNNRLEEIESEIGEESMPWFLEKTSNIEITLDDYLGNKLGCRSRYDPESEFKSILSSLYGYENSKLGERVRSLEVLHKPEKYEGKETSEDVQRELRNATPLGLIDDNGALTQDGEALYRKVSADALYMEW